ncbi:sugar O-acetyltransferase [Halococcus agarilyticus]|uniref:sugar O-acetyltransferase n=1 Tax=Halococcus agarilyticus TaxID=1232219 RepID=UPI000677A40E|nr:sugar O-acetyltransferase [Halococcus agarilyticus]
MPTEKAKMLNGEPYDASDPELVAERERARKRTRQYNATDETAHERRNELLDELLGSTGTDPYVEPPFRCDYGDNIHVGEEFYANFDCVMLDVRRIEIGRNCLVGPGVHVYTATHPIGAAERAEGLESGEPVTVGDDVWIGGRAVIDPGVTVGDGAVIGSGAVVTEDVPDGVVVKGNPAEIVKELD